MANLSNLSRKELVLQYLLDRKNEWVNGPELANEEVGGSEGLKRLRELRSEGLPIQTRRHPDPARDVWQYRYVVPEGPPVSPLRPSVAKETRASDRFETRPEKLDFGTMRLCPRCGAVKPAGCDRCNGFGVIRL
jgi:hypothetical protein